MTRKDRIRRVVLLCCHFARNLAYYRAGREGKRFVAPDTQFWTTVNGNFLDLCVLEWCKLFGEKSGEHYWGRIVSDPDGFRSELLRHIGVEGSDFELQVKKIRRYRNRFVAHLDSDLKADLPNLDVAKSSARFYHGHVVASEARADDLRGLPDDLNRYYDQCYREAVKQYRELRPTA
jgi:hypothetical protein